VRDIDAVARRFESSVIRKGSPLRASVCLPAPSRRRVRAAIDTRVTVPDLVAAVLAVTCSSCLPHPPRRSRRRLGSLLPKATIPGPPLSTLARGAAGVSILAASRVLSASCGRGGPFVDRVLAAARKDAAARASSRRGRTDLRSSLFAIEAAIAGVADGAAAGRDLGAVHRCRVSIE
jgi:hypothetical protein